MSLVGAPTGDVLLHEEPAMTGLWESPLVPGGPGRSNNCATVPMASPMLFTQTLGHFEFSGVSATGNSMSYGTTPAQLPTVAPGRLDCNASAHLDISSDESRRLDAFFSCLCESLVATLRSEFLGHLTQERENLRRQHEVEMKRLHENHKESLTRLVASLQPGETISLEQPGPAKEPESGSARTCPNIPSQFTGSMTPDPGRAPATPGRARSPETQVVPERSRSTLPARLAREMQGLLTQAPQMPQPQTVLPTSPHVGGLHSHSYAPPGNHSYIDTSPPPAQRQVVHVPSASSARRNVSPPPMPVAASGVGTPQTQPRPVSRTASPLTQKRFPIVNPGPVVQVTAPQQQPVAGRVNVYTPGSPAQGVLSRPGHVVTHGGRGSSPPPVQRGTPVVPQSGHPCQIPSRDSSSNIGRGVATGGVVPVQVATAAVTPDRDFVGLQGVGTVPVAGLSFNPPPVNLEWLSSAAPAAAAGVKPAPMQSPAALPANSPPAHERAMPLAGKQLSAEQTESAAP